MSLSRRSTLKIMAGSAVPLTGCNSQIKIDEKAEKIEQYQRFEEQFLFVDGEIKHPVYRAGSGPGILLMHELPGMTPEFWRFASWLTEAGFTVYAPDLYADALGDMTKPALAGNFVKACISRELHLFARNASSPVTVWLRALAVKIHGECGGPGIGAIGMCMTGNFALSLVLENAVIAPVASQPAMPVNYWTRKSKGALHLSDIEKEALKSRDEVDIMGLRFKGDPTCTAARFEAIQELIGKSRFHKIELDDTAQNPDGNPYPHAVLTKDLIDEEGSLTLKARDSVFSFLRARLLTDQPAKLL